MSSEVPLKILAQCFLRSYLAGAAYNPRGLQSIGMVHALAPGLNVLYPDPKRFAQACKRYVEHHNCHPFWAPLLIGVFLHTERDMARGRFPESVFPGIKDAASNALSAIGDSTFRGSLLPFWAFWGCGLVLAGQALAALGISLAFVVILQFLRLACFIVGLRQGLKILARMRSLDLINLGDILKLVNSLLLAGLLVLALQLVEPGKEVWLLSGPEALKRWGPPLLAIGLCVWGLRRLHLSRIILALIVVASLCFLA